MRVKRAEKPWGYELLVACTEHYAGKILCIRAGQRLSLQHHVRKDETLFLLEGDAELELQGGGESFSRCRLAANASYRVRAGVKHRLTALRDSRVLEISTPDLGDLVRWEDDYGRDVAGSAPCPLEMQPC
jgi:mannose-6-phosphate isomerase